MKPGDRELNVCVYMREAFDLWISHGFEPGSCGMLLLAGRYEEAKYHAHPLLKPHFDDHIAYVKTLPEECRGENMDAWKAGKSG